MPQLASYRLRVAIPARHLSCQYRIGAPGNPTFFFKNGDVDLARKLDCGIVYDVVNDRFTGKNADQYRGMCEVADVITCASDVMAEIVHKHTGRYAAIVDDPYENELQPPSCYGNGVFWLGHAANLSSLLPHIVDVQEVGSLIVCSNFASAELPWSLENEARGFHGAAVVLLTGSNPGASNNRVVKALRAGRFVVAPKDCAESWRELAPYIWIGNVAEGIRWAFANREEACTKILAAQKYTQERYSPKKIAGQWMEVFGSI